MAKRLESLKIRGFRGATREVEFCFEADKGVVLIFGENGTGKSTIVDALDFICNRNAGFLKGGQETSVKEHVPSLGSRPDDVAIALKYGGCQWSASLKSRKPHVRGPAGCPNVAILRRAKLLDFVDAQPAERYKTLAAFIDVSRVERSEQGLRDALKQVGEEIVLAVRAKDEALRDLEVAWKAEGRPSPDPTKWAQAKAKDDLGVLQRNQHEIVVILDALDRAKQANHDRETSKEKWTLAKKTLVSAQEALQAAEGVSKEAESQLLQLLEQAQSYIDKHPELAVCPVCERPIDPAELRIRIIARRVAGRAVEAAASAVQQARETVEQKRTLLNAREEDAIQQARRFVESVRTSALPAVKAQKADWTVYPLLFAPSDPNSRESAAEQAGALLTASEGLANLLKVLQDAVNKDIANLKDVQRLSGKLADNKLSLEALQPLRERLEKTLGVVELRRQEYVEGVLELVADRVEALYSLLHPHEKVGNIKFLLDREKRASLSIRGSFETRDDVPPQAYYSESHLDTLGICIFLALAEHYAAADTIIVLDDVLTSTDQQHLERFMDLVHEECARSHQVILTTHYRPLWDRYTYMQGPSAKVQMIELLRWTHARGVQHSKAKLEIDELRRLLESEPVDRQAVASKAGVLLEAALDRMTLLYGCRVRRKASGDYTLGELLDGIVKLKKSLQSGAEPFQAATCLEPCLGRLASLKWIRNQVGAHFSYKGMDVADKQVVEFGRATIEFLDLLVCPKCGDLPRKHDGSRWNCGCRTRWMMPLTIPGESLSETAAS